MASALFAVIRWDKFSARFARCPISLDWGCKGKWKNKCPLVVGRNFNLFAAYAEVENAKYGWEPGASKFAGKDLELQEELCKKAITRAMATIREAAYDADARPDKYRFTHLN